MADISKIKVLDGTSYDLKDSKAYRFGETVSHRRAGGRNLAPYYVTFNNNKFTLDFPTLIRSVGGLGDHFYSAYNNPDMTVTCSYPSIAMSTLFSPSASNTVLIPTTDLSTNPFVITVEKTSAGNINATDVTHVTLFEHTLGQTPARLTDYKLEILTTGSTASTGTYSWQTVYERSGVSDVINGLTMPMNDTSYSYLYFRGVRLTVSGATPISTSSSGWGYNCFDLALFCLFSTRPDFSSARSIGALDIHGGEVYGNVKFDAGITATVTGALNGNASTATKATQDESGNNIKASYASAISISDHTITLKNKNGTSLGTVTVPDNTVSPATATPLVAGTGAVGTATKYAREDHVHPAQTTVNGHTVNSDVPANAVFTDTHRPIQVNGTQILGDNTTALNLKAGSNVSVTNSSGTVTIAATDTTYESKTAASGGTDVSLVTTGEKYTWNNKSSLALGTTSSTAYRGDYGAAAYAHGVTNKGSAFASGMYKITTNSEGHVTAATAVAKGDITALGIPAQDTTYESKAAASGGTAVSLVTTGEKYTWNNKSNLALGTTSSTAYRGDYGNAAYAHGVTNKGSAFASGLYKITTNSEGHVTAATAVAKGDITALGIPAQDTTYESKTAVNGGTALSLVTTGEKYTWNSKGTYSKPSGGIPASDLASNVISRIFPAGGSSGQFLAKNSVTDYDLGWADQTTYVTASVSGALHTIDKTYDELKTLINKGNHVILIYYGDPYQLDSIKTSGTIKFARSTVNEGDNTVSKVTFEITKSGTNTNVSRVVDTIYVPRVFVGATVFDVYNDGEGGYTVSCTGAEDMGDIFLAGTTHSLSLTYHKVEMGEPGVDGNLEQYELVSSYTTNEYSSEIGDYMYTGHLVFNSVDTTSSKIKTFVISDVLYMDPYFESATITYSESPLGGGGIVSQNVQVAANAWASDNTYANYPYKATITISGVTSSMIPEVVFGPDDAASGNYAAVASTGTNAVYIYAKQAGAVAITIPTIIVR